MPELDKNCIVLIIINFVFFSKVKELIIMRFNLDKFLIPGKLIESNLVELATAPLVTLASSFLYTEWINQKNIEIAKPVREIDVKTLANTSMNIIFDVLLLVMVSIGVYRIITKNTWCFF
ncbi:MAG: hypothetical protein APR63_14765 [Desulfuromonas sp. SDB]|nr:MAG: hypothetical protein APR63_14765 [Desulfuromonas sp. SDB]